MATNVVGSHSRETCASSPRSILSGTENSVKVAPRFHKLDGRFREKYNHLVNPRQ